MNNGESAPEPHLRAANEVERGKSLLKLFALHTFLASKSNGADQAGLLAVVVKGVSNDEKIGWRREHTPYKSVDADGHDWRCFGN